MKQSHYVTKYDYINYYIKQPSMWFFKNSEIKAAYDLEISKYTHQSTNQYLDLEEDEVDEDNEEDTYEKYRELLDENSDLDKNNPLLVSGIIIDQMSKEFIIKYHKEKYHCDFFIKDFDLSKENLVTASKLTTQLMQEYEYLILFQPVFIDEQLKILTKCDVVVKYHNEIYLIETKATSSAKYHHFLDLFFQKKIIENLYSTNKYDFNYQLCLIKYEYLPAKQVSFIISDTINLLKNVSSSTIPVDTLEIKQKVKLGDGYEYTSDKTGKLIKKEPLFINDVLECNKTFLTHPKITKVGVSENSYKSSNKVNDVSGVVYEFNDVITKLWNHKNLMDSEDNLLKKESKQLLPKEFLPHQNDKSNFKNTDMWLELRTLYALKGIKAFKYSGNVIDQNGANLAKLSEFYLEHLEPNLTEFLKGTKETQESFKSLFFKTGSPNFFIVNKEIKELINKLKLCRVYFDFETINPAIRVLDNSLPFTQIVTQCSILVDNGDGIEEHCSNLMADPSCLTTSFFKELVDKLYHGPNYSYVVYNQTFERCRLQEISKFINEPEYTNKINVIVSNIYDLADFFKITKNKQALFIKELGGFYSIKKVLPLVDKYAPNIFTTTKCVDYHELNIYNGLVCQMKSLSRFYGNISDEEWVNIVADSKMYCENDVRAMVAVLYLVLDKFIQDPQIIHY